MKFGQREIKRTVPVIEDGSLTYNLPLQRVGPSTWSRVHNSNYGINFVDGKPLRQQTFPEAARLANFVLAIRDDENVSPVIEAINRYVLTGNTLTLWTPQGLYAVDFPRDELAEQLNKDRQKELLEVQRSLDKRLSGATGKLVQTSQDGYVRFTGHDNIIYDVQGRDVFAGNSGLIVVAGNEENAKGLSEASRSYRLNPGFWGIGKQNKLTVRVPVLGSRDFDGGLYVAAVRAGDGVSRCSFGVSESGEATRAK